MDPQPQPVVPVVLPIVPATPDHVEAVADKQTADLKTSSFYRMLATIGSVIVGFVLLLLDNYAGIARRNPNDDAQTLAVKVLQEQIQTLTQKLVTPPAPPAPVPPAPLPSPPPAPKPSFDPALKLWLPGPSGQPGDGSWTTLGQLLKEKK